MQPVELPALDPSALKPALNPILITNDSQLPLLEEFFENCDTFGFDAETNVVKRFVERKVRTIQVGSRDVQYVIDLLGFAGSPERLMEQGGKKTPEWAANLVQCLRKGLESGKHLKVGVNLQFDYECSWWGLGLRPWHFYDCFLAEKVLYSGRVHFKSKGFWAMDDMVARYCKRKISKEQQKTFNLTDPLTEEQIVYAALDTRLSLAIRAGQDKPIAKAKLGRAVQIENDAVPAFGDMHINGFYLDSKAWLEMVSDTRRQHAENVQALDTYFIPIVGRKNEVLAKLTETAQWAEARWREEKDRDQRKAYQKQFYAARRQMKAIEKEMPKFEGEAAINYGSHPQLLDALRKAGFGIKQLPNTNDKTLRKLADRPIIKALKAYRKTEKLLSTYSENWLEKIWEETGRIHSNINQLGAETGRTSSDNPNIQNIPRGSALRACFKARPGYKMITDDMSGAELRILAESARYQVWIDAFNRDEDVHSVGAVLLRAQQWADGSLPECSFNLTKKKCNCPAHKKIRTGNKECNFGIAYGMEKWGLADKLDCSVDEAGSLLEDWKKINQPLVVHLEECGNRAVQQLCARTLSGRWRLFERPTWEKAKELTFKRAKEDKKPIENITTSDVSRTLKGLYNSIVREGKNVPFQGTNADIAKVAMGCGFDENGEPYMWHRLLPEFGGELVNFVHDEWVVECPEENCQPCLEMMGDCVRRAGAEFLSLVTMEHEGVIADEWSK